MARCCCYNHTFPSAADKGIATTAHLATTLRSKTKDVEEPAQHGDCRLRDEIPCAVRLLAPTSITKARMQEEEMNIIGPEDDLQLLLNILHFLVQ